MATTTTINPTSDTRMYENAPTTNYGTSTLLKIGYATGTSKMDNSVFRFDVSGYSPQDIVSAVFTLKVANEWGSSTRTMTLARCTKEWVDTECTWNIYSTGNDWTAGGGVSDTALTEPTYTLDIGNSSGDRVVDITELVKDAINKRAGNLNFIMYMQSAPASTAIATYHSVNATDASNRPALAITVATRKVWDGGAGDHNVNSTRNWTPVGVPTSNDYAIFNSGSDYANTGTLSANKVFIGKNFKGRLGTGSIAKLDIDDLTEFHCSSASAELYVNINDGQSSACEVYFKDSNRTDGTVIIDGKYNCTMSRTRHSIELQTTDTEVIDAHSRNAQFKCTDDVATIRITGAYATLDDAGNSITIAGRGYAKISKVNKDDATIVLAGRSSARVYADEFDIVTIYNGKLTLKGNEGAPIQAGGLVIYGEGLADVRTGAATFTLSAPASLLGGRLLIDGGVSAGIS